MFINGSQTIGIIMGRSVAYTTGSMILSLLIVVIIIITMAMMFQIKLEWTAILILPLLLGYMTYYSEFVAIGSVILIYLAIVFTKTFIFH